LLGSSCAETLSGTAFGTPYPKVVTAQVAA
jgi:hypothetical protein